MNPTHIAVFLTLLLCLPAARAATFTVTTPEDEFDTPSGASVSLAEALRDAASQPGADIVHFDSSLSGQNLSSRSQFTVNDSDGVTVDASNLRNGLTLSGSSSHRIFHVTASGTLELIGLNLTAGASGELNGGAILNDGTLTLTRSSLFGNNSRAKGGAVFNTGKITATRCTFSGNGAANSGGAFANQGRLTLRHCTLADNSAGAGGAVHNLPGSDLLLENSILGSNLSPSGSDVNNEGSLLLEGANLIQGLAGAAPSGPGFRINAAPMLSPLGYHGGTTQTRSPLADSPARNAATSSSGGPDQRGFPIVSTPDLGACEIQIGPIAGVVMNQNSSVGPIVFNVGTVGAISVTTSDPRLIDPRNVVIGGTAPDLTFTLTPGAGVFGVVIITLTDNNSGDVVTFMVNINNAPSITNIPDTTIIEGTHTEKLDFKVDDLETDANALSVTATSGNTTLVDAAGIVLGGTGGDRSLVVTPVAKQVGTVSIKVTVSDGLHDVDISFLLTVLPDTPLSNWKVAAFGNAASKADVSGDAADPDQDGVSNLIEYALRSDPVSGSPSPFGAPVPVTLAGNIPAIRMTFPYRPQAADVAYLVEHSPDLTDWKQVYELNLAANTVTQLAGVVGEVDPVAETVTVTITVPSFLSGKNFWRLGVEKP